MPRDPRDPAGLPIRAYSLHDEDAPYTPLITDHEPVEATGRATLYGLTAGVLIGTGLWGAARHSAPAALVTATMLVLPLTAAVTRLLRPRPADAARGVLEQNQLITVASAVIGASIGACLWRFGVPTTVVPGERLVIAARVLIGGVLGVIGAMLLRRHVIVREPGRPPFPEALAQAELLVAGGAQPPGLRRGLWLGAAAQSVFEVLRWLSGRLAPVVFDPRGVPLPAAGMIGTGFLIGARGAVLLVLGSVLGRLLRWGVAQRVWHVTGRFVAEQDLHQWLPLGLLVGAVLGWLLTHARGLLTSYRAGKGGFRVRFEIGGEGTRIEDMTPRPGRDLSPGAVALSLAAITLSLIAMPSLLSSSPSIAQRGALVPGLLAGALLAALVSVRACGLLGVAGIPWFGLTGMGALLCAAPAAIDTATLEAGALVLLVAMCVAALTGQALKCGFLLGATPQRQQSGALLGVLVGAALVGWMIKPSSAADPVPSLLLGTPTRLLGWPPQLALGCVVAVVVVAALATLCWKDSLVVALGVLLPLSWAVPLLLGGLVRRSLTGAAAAVGVGLRLAVGCMVGAAAVAVAGALIATRRSTPLAAPEFGATFWPTLLAVGAMVALAFLFRRACVAGSAS